MKRSASVIIVGAGAAGIACARRLKKAGVDFLILEARNRAGGRVYSHPGADSEIPAELGAEFIHGATGELIKWIREQGRIFYDVKDKHFMRRGGRLKEFGDFWEKMGSVMDRLNPKTDRRIVDFLSAQRALPAETKELFKAFVEGFHGADLELIGEAGLAATEESDDAELNESSLFRPLGRYDTILYRALVPARDELRINSEVQAIRWKRGRAELFCRQGPGGEKAEYVCEKLVLTLPLGVLKSPTLHWDPELKPLTAAIENLHMGHAQRIIFAFHSRFWEKLSNKPIVFMHTGPEDYFPTWWNYQPVRSPHLVAWQGGPKARTLSSLPPEERALTALKTLSKLTKIPVRELKTGLISWHTHDWSSDPYSLGAYSYIGTGGMAGARRLRRNFENTVFLAGEATAEGSDRGTVHGAIASGQRAAEQILGGI